MIVICLQTSCSKSIYINSNSNGTSKYILYKNYYKYIERSIFGKFSETGTYIVNDSLISFVYRNKNKIPFTYQGDNVQIQNMRKDKEYQRIYLTDKNHKSPIPFAPITLKDSLGNLVSNADAGIDGLAFIKNNKDIYTVEINYEGYLKQIFFYDKYYEYDLTIKLEDFKPGGRMTNECLIEYLDIILEYQIDNPLQINKLERNGVVYIKQNVTP